MTDYYDCTKDDEILLEPRLSEYLKKKKYFRDNGIESTTMEQEYYITNKDMQKIRAYLRGEKCVTNNKYQDFVDPTQSEFPSTKIKDKRMERIKKKQENTVANIKSNCTVLGFIKNVVFKKL